MALLLILHIILAFVIPAAALVLWLLNLSSLRREPAARRFDWVQYLAYLAIAQLASGLLMIWGGLRPNEPLHAVYGTLTVVLLHFLGGLKPQSGWFYRTLTNPPPRVGMYLFWGLLLAFLLSGRALMTGLGFL